MAFLRVESKTQEYEKHYLKNLKSGQVVRSPDGDHWMVIGDTTVNQSKQFLHLEDVYLASNPASSNVDSNFVEGVLLPTGSVIKVTVS